MTTEIDSLRKRIGKLYIDRTVGDVTEKVFQREIAESTVDLYRATIKTKLAEGEELIADHHSISSHFRVTQSLLKEPDQHATSIFVTDRRLLQLQSTVFPGQPPTADSRDNTVVNEITLDHISELKFKRQFRIGEAAVGAVMCGIGILFYEELSLTGPILVGLGALGILHTTIWPTRWVEVKATDNSREPIMIYTVKKKSAKKLLKLLRERERR
ncbi:MAG: hypothetical protein AB9866_13300 [Syntrophobacteraceae bacterium]